MIIIGVPVHPKCVVEFFHTKLGGGHFFIVQKVIFNIDCHVYVNVCVFVCVCVF